MMYTTVVRSKIKRPFRAHRAVLLGLCLHMVTASWAQLGVKVVNFRPTGELGEVMERAYSAQLMYIGDFEETARARFFLTHYKLKPRLDQFPTTGYEYRDGIWTVYPGVQSWEKYNLLIFGGGLDLGLLQLLDDRLTLYPGFEIFGGGLNQEYNSNTPGMTSESFSGGLMLAGIGLRAGADHAFSDAVAVFAEWTTSTYFVAETGRFTYNDIGIGARFTF